MAANIQNGRPHIFSNWPYKNTGNYVIAFSSLFFLCNVKLKIALKLHFIVYASKSPWLIFIELDFLRDNFDGNLSILIGQIVVVLNWIKLVKNLWKFYFNLFHLDSLINKLYFPLDSIICLFVFWRKFNEVQVKDSREWRRTLNSHVNINWIGKLERFPKDCGISGLHNSNCVSIYLCVEGKSVHIFTFSHFHNHNVLLSSDFQ